MAEKNNKTTFAKDWKERNYFRLSIRALAILLVFILAVACGISTGYAVFGLWGLTAALIFGGAGIIANIVIFWSNTQNVLLSLFTTEFWSDLLTDDVLEDEKVSEGSKPTTPSAWRAFFALLAGLLSIGCGFVSFGYSLVATSFVLGALGLTGMSLVVLPYVIAISMSVGMTLIIFSSVKPFAKDPAGSLKKFLKLFQRKDDESKVAHISRVALIVLSFGIALVATLATVNAWGAKLTTFLTVYGPGFSAHVVNTVVAAFVWTAFIGNLVFNAQGLIQFSEIVVPFFDKCGENWASFKDFYKEHGLLVTVKWGGVFLLLGVMICLNAVSNGALARSGTTPMGRYPLIQLLCDTLRSASTGGGFGVKLGAGMVNPTPSGAVDGGDPTTPPVSGSPATGEREAVATDGLTPVGV